MGDMTHTWLRTWKAQPETGGVPRRAGGRDVVGAILMTSHPALNQAGQWRDGQQGRARLGVPDPGGPWASQPPAELGLQQAPLLHPAHFMNIPLRASAQVPGSSSHEAEAQIPQDTIWEWACGPLLSAGQPGLSCASEHREQTQTDSCATHTPMVRGSKGLLPSSPRQAPMGCGLSRQTMLLQLYS